MKLAYERPVKEVLWTKWEREFVDIETLEEVKVLASSLGFSGVAIDWWDYPGADGEIRFFNDICDDIC